MSVVSRARRTIREHDLARAATRVVVAVSGGSDSVALTHIVTALASEGALVFAGLAHFNHHLRDTAARDEQLCRELADSLAVPVEVGHGDVAALARAERRSIEDAAHRARHAFLEDASRRLGADAIALGHTRDDQAETFLLRLIRGAGARGLAAMHPRNRLFIRPLLDCRRHDLVEWLRARGFEYIHDESNDDLAIPRNRIRAELLPLLTDRFNPAIIDVLAAEAELARGEWEWLEEAADATLAAVAVFGTDAIELDAARLSTMPLGLQRAVLWRAMSRLTRRPVSFRHVTDAVLLLGSSADGLELDVPGQRVNRIAGRLVLTSTKGPARRRDAVEANLFEYSLSIPGEISIPEADGVLIAQEGGCDGRPAAERNVAVVRRDLCGARLTVRSRRPGDRFRPLGVGGSRKLQDVFVDRKVARAERDRIPVVLHENGRIVWIAGVGISEEFRVTDPAQPMLTLRFRVVGGSA